jgi:hypothetical protein
MATASNTCLLSESLLETGNTLESVIRTVPLLVLIGRCASIRWLKLCGRRSHFESCRRFGKVP